MKHLFVCSVGVTRSPEAVFVANELASFYKISPYEADYFGLDSGVAISKDVFQNYDLVIVMEECHKKDLMEKYSVDEAKIRVLDIPDEHSRSESKLKDILDRVLLEKLQPIFKELSLKEKHADGK